MSGHRPDDDEEDLFEEPTLEEIRAPATSGIKPEVAAALAALKPARSTTVVPPSPPPAPLPKPASSPKSASSSWSPPRVPLEPIAWGAFVTIALLMSIALVRARPAAVVVEEADVPVIALGADAVACTALTSRGRQLLCALAPAQLDTFDERERASRLDATRVQARAGGFASVVLVDAGRVWRVLHADVAIVAPTRRTRR